jgi:AraC-like DNA-binding protein
MPRLLWLMFQVPMSSPQMTRMLGFLERLPSLVAGESVSLAAGAGHDHLVLHLPHSRLLEAAERVGLGAVGAIRAGRSQPMLAAHSPALQHLDGLLTSLLASAVVGDRRIPAAHLDELVLGSILSALDLEPGHLRGAAPAAALVRRAIAAFDAAVETAEEPPTITALCLSLRASPRTLEAAFQHVVGAGPHRFFVQRRLNRAFRLLAAAEHGQVRVSDVATRLGFTELGRFAVRYRALFGESPSATLRRPARRLVAVPSMGLG